ncbi:Mss4-like protein [Trichoderma aethiopicum]
MSAGEKVVYQGNCHCGRYRFQVSVPEIESAITCTCSLCLKKGYLWLIPAEGSFTVLRDGGCLVEYQTSTIRDKFCSYCGSGVQGEHLTGPLKDKFVINIGTLREPYVNPFKLESALRVVEAEGDTRSIDPLPCEPGEAPAKALFSCHCGDVRAALLGPLEHEELKEDNCSKCVRTAYIGTYPAKHNVRIYGRDRVFEYLTGGKFTGSTFCNTCGVHVFSNVYGPPISVFDKLPPERKEKALAVYHKNMAMQPLNVRAAEGIRLDDLRPLINRQDEGTEGYELSR